MPRRKQALAALSLVQVIEKYPTIRQSLLSVFDDCTLSAKFQLEGGGRYTNDAQARGILFHRTAARILKSMQASGTTKMPVGEGLRILYDVCRQHDVPDREVVLPSARERRVLRIVTIKFCHESSFGMRRLIAVERRLSAKVTYVHHKTGEVVERTITGAPDALLANPPIVDNDGRVVRPTTGVTVLDWKTTRKAPPKGPPRDHPDPKKADHWDDPDHLSYHGYFQQRFYGLLCLLTYPNIDFVEMKEFYPFENVGRFGTVYRADLESLLEEFSLLVELLDRALVGGTNSEIFQPSPGFHCGYCVAHTRCPLDAVDRVKAGGIASWPEAKMAAAEYVQAKSVRDDMQKALKAWVTAHGPIPVKRSKGRAELRFRNNTTGKGQTFGLWVPADSDRGPLGMEVDREADEQIEAAFAEVADRVKVKST